ncbi:MAG TPA: copper-binding protein, partial [Sphingobium sp.]|nr:copper-binding protein [Sphingobium sp.]
MSRRRSATILISLVLTASASAQSATDNWSGARPMTLTLSSFKFAPSDVVLEHGVPYRLHFVNSSTGGHDFAAKTFFQQAQVMPEDRAKIRGGRVELGGGESVDVRLIAP